MAASQQSLVVRQRRTYARYVLSHIRFASQLVYPCGMSATSLSVAAALTTAK